jgi:hypothetical protein
MSKLQINLNNGRAVAVEMSSIYARQLVADYSTYLQNQSSPTRQYITVNPTGSLTIALSAVQSVELID